MADSSFDETRKTFIPTAGGGSNVLAGPTAVAYEAFKVNSGKRRYLMRLGLRPMKQAWERVLYSQLLRISEDGFHGQAVALVFPFMDVIIRGRNLRPIVDAIDLETCEFVQQFNPGRWAEPADPNLPFITSMDLVYPDMLGREEPSALSRS